MPGAFLAALLIGQLQAFRNSDLPEDHAGAGVPADGAGAGGATWGLMGRPDVGVARVVLPEGIVRSRVSAGPSTSRRVLGVALLLLPLIGDAYLIKAAIEVLCFALAAFSLNFLIGVGGIVSFGHAAYFGLGAYAAGLLVTRLGSSMEPALLAAGRSPGRRGAVWVLHRAADGHLSGHAHAGVRADRLRGGLPVGGGDGRRQWRGGSVAALAAGRVTYYYLTLAVSAAAIVLLRQGIYAPFGYTLRGARLQRARRCHRHRRAAHRWLAFTIAGAAAGLGGGLFAFSKGSIDPTLISIPMSVDFLVMTLLGGVQTVIGPLVGAAAFHSIRDFVMPLTDYWRLLWALPSSPMRWPSRVASSAASWT